MQPNVACIREPRQLPVFVQRGAPFQLEVHADIADPCDRRPAFRKCSISWPEGAKSPSSNAIRPATEKGLFQRKRGCVLSSIGESDAHVGRLDVAGCTSPLVPSSPIHHDSLVLNQGHAIGDQPCTRGLVQRRRRRPAVGQALSQHARPAGVDRHPSAP